MKKRHRQSLALFILASMLISLFALTPLQAKESANATGTGIFLAAIYNENTTETYKTSYQKEYTMECGEDICFSSKFKETDSSEQTDISADDMDVYVDDANGNPILADKNLYTKTQFENWTLSNMRLAFSEIGTYRLRRHGVNSSDATADEVVIQVENKHIRFYSDSSCEETSQIDSETALTENDIHNNTVYMYLDPGSGIDIALINSAEKTTNSTVYPFIIYDAFAHTGDDDLANYFTYEKVANKDNLYALYLNPNAFMTNFYLCATARGTNTDETTRLYSNYVSFHSSDEEPFYVDTFDWEESGKPTIPEQADWKEPSYDPLCLPILESKDLAIGIGDDIITPVSVDKLNVLDSNGKITNDVTITKKADTIFSISSKKTGIYQLRFQWEDGQTSYQYSAPLFFVYPSVGFYDANEFDEAHLLKVTDSLQYETSYYTSGNQTFYVKAGREYKLQNVIFSAYTYEEDTGNKITLSDENMPFTTSTDESATYETFHPITIKENQTLDFYITVSCQIAEIDDTMWSSPIEITLHLIPKGEPPALNTPTPTPAATQSPLVTSPPTTSPTATNSASTTMPTIVPKQTIAPKQAVVPSSKIQTAHFISKGLVYKIISKNGKKGKVACVKPQNKKIKKVSIPSFLKHKGILYKVTKIEKNAFKKCKKLKKIKLAKYISNIGKNAFYKTAKKPIFYMPKSKKKQYQKLLKKSGLKRKKYVIK